MLKPVERPSRISTLGFTLFIAWVPPKSEWPSSTSYVAGCDATSRRAARPTESSPENSPENPVLPLRVSFTYIILVNNRDFTAFDFNYEIHQWPWANSRSRSYNQKAVKPRWFTRKVYLNELT